MLKHEKPWHQLLCMASRFCCPELEKSALVAIQDYHSQTQTVCHPSLLEFDLRNSPPAKGLMGYIVEEFCRITFGPDQDFNKMLDFLHVQCPTTLIEGVKKMRNKAVAWPTIPQSKRVNGGV